MRSSSSQSAKIKFEGLGKEANSSWMHVLNKDGAYGMISFVNSWGNG